MKRIPTDLQILNAIYQRYYQVFAAYSEKNKQRTTKNFVPVDIKTIAKDLDVDPDIILGRLHYHLDKKYGYDTGENERVSFFAEGFARDGNCINFILLASVLADMREQNKKYRIATTMAVVSLSLSIFSLVIHFWR